jgi:hypothetical protein
MKKLTILNVMLFALLCMMNTLTAQVNIGGAPMSFNYEKTEILKPLTFDAMPPLDMAIIEIEDAQWDAEVAAGHSKIGRRFGIEFEVDYDLYNSGIWTDLPDGGKLWRLGIECPGALSINLIFDQYRLPKGATLYIFSDNTNDKIGGFTDYNNQADNFFATDIVLSDKIVIEYYQPANAAFDAELRLATVIHGYRGSSAFQKGFGQSGACQRNTSCPEAETWQDQVRAVFALYSGGNELCSGTILNNTANDRKPYALTANHCWNAYQNPGIWVFRFNWDSPTCTPTTNSTYQTMSGAVLRMRSPTNTSSTDACLVELNQQIPEDYGVFYSGWSRSTVPSPHAMCISHPSLDIKKISPTLPLYTVVQYVLGWRTDWSTPACTEGGSSGSGLFDSNHRLVGQLYGGLSGCSTYGTPNHFDVYGRFDMSWNALPGAVSDLKTWLDPLNLNPETWDGFYGEMFDAELTEIIVPVESYNSAATIEPKVKIKNTGDFPITEATVFYTIDGGYPVIKTWEGNLDLGATTDITFDAITLTYGTHVFEATVAIEDDGNASNNTKSKNYEVTIGNAPYVNYDSYEVVGGDLLTYFSTNKEIAVTLKNVGTLPANGPLNVTFSCDDPQLTITQATAQCETIAPDGTATVICKVTVANDIPDNKIFHINVSVANSQDTWGSKMTIVAYAPKFKLEKVLINGVENGNLPKGELVVVKAMIKNEGGAAAYNVKGELEINSPYITLACSEIAPVIQLLSAGESKALDFYILADSDMPSGHEAVIDLLLSAMYGRSYETPFKVVNAGSNNYCMPGNSNCSGYNDRITSLIIENKSDQSVLYSNTDPQCVPTIGYTDYTNVILNFIPEKQYTIKVKTGYVNHRVRGWIDLNGNNTFDDSEIMFTIACAVVGTEYSQDFTIPQDFAPGEQRFRIRTRDGSNIPGACDTYSYGQTLDFTAVFPELYPRVQNVEAVLQGSNIIITWETPEEETPMGYNIYKDGDKLNSTVITDLNFIETGIEQGVYAYSVKAVYTGNKESFAEMSNVICFFLSCKPPTNLQGTVEGKTATITWEDSDAMEGTLLGYNIYRNDEKLNTELLTDKEFIDENLAVGMYLYQVSAVYEHCEESDLTAELTITIVPEFCEPPVNVEITTEETFFLITWDEPENIDGVLLGYNVYLNDNKVNDGVLEEKEYRAELTETGSYQVSVVYEHCESELSETVGIKEHFASSFNIFPNPTTGEFRILSSEFQVRNIAIFDVYGKCVFKLETQNSKSETIINVSHLQSGIYFVRIYSETNDIAVKRVVIMK